MSSWSPEAIDAAVDEKMGATAPNADPTPPAAPALAPPVPEVQPPAALQPDPALAVQPAIPEIPAPEQPAAPAEEIVDDAAAYRAAVDKIGGLEELELMTSLATPLMAAELDPDAFYTAIIENRGRNAYEKLAWSQFDRNATSYADEIFNNPNFNLDLIRDPNLRAQVAQVRSGAAPAPAPAAPVPSYQPAPQPAVSARPAALPAINLEDFDLPKEVTEFIAAAQSQAATIASIQVRQDEFDRLQREEQERRNQEAQRTNETVTQTRLVALTSQIHTVIDSLLTPVAFSTQIDAALASAENADTRADIKARVIHDLEADSAFGDIYHRAKEAYQKGDRIGAREDVRQIKQIVDAKVKERITARGGKLKAAVAAGNPVVNNPRVNVSGPGSGAAPQLPTPPAAQNGGKAWENIDQQIDARIAALRPSPPVG